MVLNICKVHLKMFANPKTCSYCQTCKYLTVDKAVACDLYLAPAVASISTL